MTDKIKRSKHATFSIIGETLFWILWPALVAYFRINHTRSRVIVICEGEVLLLQGWLGTARLTLPGGGAKRGESSKDAAVRELVEETGITVTPNSLKYIALYHHNQYGMRYNARIYSVELNSRPKLKLQKIEVLSAQWINYESAKDLKLNADTIYAMSKYRPLEQARLL